MVCPAVQAELQWKNRTWGSTMQLIRELYREQCLAFSEVDFVATWFYDPGGCMCGLHRHNCRGMQAERMLGLVSAMKEEAAAAIPNLRRVDVDTWATWVSTSEFRGIRPKFRRQLGLNFLLWGRCSRAARAHRRLRPGPTATSSLTS